MPQTENLSDERDDGRGHDKAEPSSRAKGFAVLIDMRESVFYKNDHPDEWLGHILTLYSEFDGFIETVRLALDVRQEDSCVKHLGDGALVFIEHNGTGDATEKLMRLAINFKRHLITKIDGNNIRIKMVATFIDDVHRVENGVLGLGIDFTLHLEEFCGDTHLVINESLLKALAGFDGATYNGLPVEMRQTFFVGADAPQRYWIIVVERRREARREEPTNLQFCQSYPS